VGHICNMSTGLQWVLMCMCESIGQKAAENDLLIDRAETVQTVQLQHLGNFLTRPPWTSMSSVWHTADPPKGLTGEELAALAEHGFLFLKQNLKTFFYIQTYFINKHCAKLLLFIIIYFMLHFLNRSVYNTTHKTPPFMLLCL